MDGFLVKKLFGFRFTFIISTGITWRNEYNPSVGSFDVPSYV